MLLDVNLSVDASRVALASTCLSSCSVLRSHSSLLQKYSHSPYIHLCLEIVILFQYAQTIKSYAASCHFPLLALVTCKREEVFCLGHVPFFKGTEKVRTTVPLNFTCQ